MATFLDVTGLAYFSKIFIFIFVWVIVYALLATSRVLGENKFVQMVISLIIGILVLISPIATGTISYIAPWFGVIAVFLILVIFLGRSFGADMLGSEARGFIILIIVFFLVAGALSYVRSQVTIPGDNETATDYERDYTKTATIIFHPTVLGIIIIILIAVFTIALMAGKWK